VRLDVVTIEDLADRALREVGQARMSGGHGVVADVARQQPRGPQFVRISKVFGLLAGQRHQPRLRFIGDRRRLAGTRAVVERGHHAEPHGPLQTAKHGLMRHSNGLAHRIGRRVGAIGQQDARPLDPTRRLGSRPRDHLQSRQIVVSDRYLDHPPWCRHRRRANMLKVHPRSTYNMSSRVGNRPQQVGFTEKMYSDVRCQGI